MFSNNKAHVLMKQAPMTANTYMRDCVEYIDAEFGKGYAKNNPQLLAKMIETCSRDYHTAVMSHIKEEEVKLQGWFHDL